MNEVDIRIPSKDWLYQLQHDGLLLKYSPRQDIQLNTIAVKNNPIVLKYKMMKCVYMLFQAVVIHLNT